MRTVTTTINVYKFEELSNEAKNKVRQSFEEDTVYNNIFADDLKEILKEDYPHSELKVQYSLNYCQGDGVNIYGTVGKEDVLEIYKTECEPLEEEMKTIELYIDEGMDVKLYENKTYCNNSFKLFQLNTIECTVENIRYELENNIQKEINTELIAKCLKAIYKHFQRLEQEFERNGYDFLYEFPDDRIIEECEANSWEFTEDGQVF